MWVHVLIAVAQEAQSSTAESSGGGPVSIPWAQILLAIVGPAGLIGSIVALFKLKPDANSQAVTQAQGAAAEWKSIADDRKKDIDELEKRLETAHIEIQRLRQELFQAQHPSP